jgi:hypothetical protein
MLVARRSPCFRFLTLETTFALRGRLLGLSILEVAFPAFSLLLEA